MKILVFEDTAHKNLYPLNLLRASFDLRCGANTILQTTESILNNKFEVSLHCRNNIAAHIKETHKEKVNSLSKDDYLFLNGKVIFSDHSLKYLISMKEKNCYFRFNKDLIAAYITKDMIPAFKNKIDKPGDENLFNAEFFESLKFKCIDLKSDFDISVINYSWDLINYMIHCGLENDFDNFLNSKQNKHFKKIKDSNDFIGHKKIFVSKNVTILPGVVLDASEGRIIINENVKVEPFTYIKGPVYIGENCTVKSGTKIYGPCVIGEHSKIAGEIAESIFHSYVNKQHDGFVGHSYISPFVNLGADTVTSDLKNNYSKIKNKLNGEEIDTGMQFLGSIIGDHSKTSINTMLNTGSIIGIFANIFGGGFPSKEIGSFSWNEAGKEPVRYNFDKAIETAKIVMERRGITMSDAYRNLAKSFS